MIFIYSILPSLTLILSNIVDIYVLGFLSVFLIFLRLVVIIGCCCVGYLFYLFISKFELYLLLLFFVELFSIILKSLTLTNRLSINYLAGTLLINLINSLFLPFHPAAEFGLIVTFIDLFIVVPMFIIFLFEFFQIPLQFAIFSLLHYSFNAIIFGCLGPS